MNIVKPNVDSLNQAVSSRRHQGWKLYGEPQIWIIPQMSASGFVNQVVNYGQVVIMDN